MSLFPKSARSRGHDLIHAIWAARDHAPVSEIEELIPLAREEAIHPEGVAIFGFETSMRNDVSEAAA